ncbi:serine hydrolase [Sinomonas gamaensis]|uniref:serine hydrolase n=1 Tax=Sinomonas gamaensis TaxID=2565624 RepID=UPI0014872919|nr:serine hydrolase domain-containing protein [Sinomonas gamaensis]
MSQRAQAVVFHVRDGEHEAYHAVGVSNLDSGAKADVGDRLWVSGEGTMMLSVAAVMKLVEEHMVGLDDRIEDHLPEFSAIFPGWDRTTLRELLGSRTGLPDYVPALLASTRPRTCARPL